MTRRDFIQAPALLAAQSRTRPNILFLMADQHRGDCMGVSGNNAIHTPNLDRIAREGARFRCAYSSTPTCTPARSALLTGLSPWHHGMLGMTRMALKYPVEKAQVLSEAGYYTACIGKNHYYPQRTPHGYKTVLLDESGRAESPEFRSDYRAWFYSEAPTLNPDATGIGWNDYPAKAYVLPERLHPTKWTADCAVNFLAKYERPEPFFLKVSFSRPHSPYDPPQRFMNQYANAELPAAKVAKWAGRYAVRNSDKWDIWHGDLGAEQVRSSRQGYYGSVSFIDEQIGRILETLEKRGLLEQTLIVYTSDHGDMTGDQNLWRKSYAYEPSAHIPMLMRWPTGLIAAERGQVFSNPVEIRDLLPTFLDAAGAGERKTDGTSLLKLVKSKGAGWREFIDLEHDICYSPENNWNALTDGKTKYIFHARDGEEQLFDLVADRHELNDLALQPAYAGELRKWRNRMIEHMSERGAPYLVNGKLGLRPKGLKHSPLFPES